MYTEQSDPSTVQDTQHGGKEGGPALVAVQHSMFAAVVMIVSNAAGLRVVTGKLHSSHCKLVFSDKNDLE